MESLSLDHQAIDDRQRKLFYVKSINHLKAQSLFSDALRAIKQFKLNFIEKNNFLEDKYNLQNYLNKFKSRYNGKLTITGDNVLNYKLNAKLNGYLDVSRDDYKNKKEEFSINLEGGLLRGEGSLKIKKLPLSAANIFLNQPRDFVGGLDMNLLYNLDTKSFSSEIYSNNSLIKNNKLVFELTKMAVKPEYRNKGIGKKLLKKCIDYSSANNCNSIILYSNNKLDNAIHLYRTFGFKETKMEKKSPYLRANIKMVWVKD